MPLPCGEVVTSATAGIAIVASLIVYLMVYVEVSQGHGKLFTTRAGCRITVVQVQVQVQVQYVVVSPVGVVHHALGEGSRLTV
ncbi:TPA: hypothetical protein U0V88_004836 [Escherichia coli]|nr:hypothetical protein [Escherichia coli]HEL8059113.1 hypothetical protein [Escherichia coli]HEM0087358.1 hypothetical protein [Escherichia coli]HEM0144456.1 hypothetical protein [Escherichia coli]HEM0854080.1 hypothetical protein [Escherichia coli]